MRVHSHAFKESAKYVGSCWWVRLLYDSVLEPCIPNVAGLQRLQLAFKINFHLLFFLLQTFHTHTLTNTTIH